MKFKVYKAEHNNLTFRIEENNPDVGVYLYVFENDNCIKDYLQNDIKTCMEIGLEKYGIPLNGWKNE